MYRRMFPKIIACVCGMTVGICTTAFSANLPGKPDTVHTTFNDAAKAIDTYHNMLIQSCGSGVAATCNYKVTGNMAALAKSVNGDASKLESVTLIFGSGSKANDMIIAMGILMLAYSPDASQSERGDALASLSSNMVSGKKDSEVILGATSYTVSVLDGLGIWFIVQHK